MNIHVTSSGFFQPKLCGAVIFNVFSGARKHSSITQLQVYAPVPARKPGASL